MTNPLRGSTAIVGAVDAVSPTGKLDRSTARLEVDMVRAALDDAGLTISDVDAVISTTGMMASLDLAERMGVRGRYTDTTMTGGSSFEVHVEHAAAAITAGLCDVAVIVYAANTEVNPRSSSAPSAERCATTPACIVPPRCFYMWYGARTGRRVRHFKSARRIRH